MKSSGASPTHGWCLLVLAAVTAVMIFLYGRIDYTNEAFTKWDSLIYREMASAAPHLDPLAPRPFAFRLLGPYLVGLFPGPPENAFFIATLILSVLLIYLMYEFLCYFGLQPKVACIATILYLFNKHFFGFTSWNYFHINDVLTNLFLIILFWSMLESRWLMFAAAFCLAIATRETALVMIPTGLLYLVEHKTLRREGGRFLGAIVPGLACYAALHLFIHPASGQTITQAISVHWTKLTSLERMYHVLVNPFIPLTLVPLVFFKRSIAFFRGRTYLVLYFILIACTPLVGANNERLLNPTFIVFYALIGFIMQESVLPNKVLPALVLTGGFLSHLHWLVARYPLPSRNATGALSGGSLAVITLALALFAVLGKSTEGSRRVSS